MPGATKRNDLWPFSFIGNAGSLTVCRLVRTDAAKAGKDRTEGRHGLYQQRAIRQIPGIFINDEWPAFGNWCNHNFGGFNAKAYDHVFELLLRLKGNYLWPAMWSARFADDGPGLLNAELADEYGIIMGMSHHEPCLRQGKNTNILGERILFTEMPGISEQTERDYKILGRWTEKKRKV